MRSATAAAIAHDDDPILRHAEPGCGLAMPRAAWRALPRMRWTGPLGAVVMFNCPRCGSTIAETTLERANDT